MKRLSATTRDLINRLHTAEKSWRRLAFSVDSADELLKEIGERAEPVAIPSIAPFLLDDRLRTAKAAARAISRLMRRLVPADLIQLDQEMRQRSPYLSPQWSKWHSLRPDELNRLIDLSEAPSTSLGLASFHASGYVRQAAVEKLASFSDGRELPFLLIRLNDWVQPVRSAAKPHLSRRIVVDYAPHFVTNLALVFNLLERGRDAHRRFVESILRLIKQPECSDALFAGLQSADRFVSRRCFELITEVPGVDVGAIIEQGLRAKDTMIRLWAARKARSVYKAGKLKAFLPVMWRDRFVPVRLEALSAYLEELSEEAPSRLRAALLDVHVAIRELAQYALRKSGGFDIAAFYRDSLGNEGQSLYAAISGLGETGSAKDAGLILPYVSHPSPKVRRAGVQALNRLDGEAYIELLLASLADDVPSVSRAARDALKTRVPLIQPGQLWRVFNQSTQPHTKRAVAFLIAALPKWESIPMLVRACADSNERVSSAAREYVHRWMRRYNRSFSQPSLRQLNLLSEALKESDSRLEAKVVEDFRQLITSWKKA